MNMRTDLRGSAPKPTRRYGVLIVDDEHHVRGLLNLVMRGQGFDVWLAASGAEALAVYQRDRNLIDLVLLDVRMPVQDGPQTLVALKKLNPRICSCFMSGDLGPYGVDELRALGAVSVLTKPFHLDEVAGIAWQLAIESQEQDNPRRLASTVSEARQQAVASSSNSSKKGFPMLSSYSVTCPREGCGWSGSVVPSHAKGGADAEIISMHRAWFCCPRCKRDWEVRITNDTVQTMPTTEFRPQ